MSEKYEFIKQGMMQELTIIDNKNKVKSERDSQNRAITLF